MHASVPPASSPQRRSSRRGKAAPATGGEAPVQTLNRQRVIDHGEVFTPPKLVNDMLDLVAHECERVDSRFLEPACGNGNFLAEVLRRKLLSVDKRNSKRRGLWERDAVLAICSLYGIDLLPDNVAACRERLVHIVQLSFRRSFGKPLADKVVDAIRYILSVNIVQGDALSFLDASGRPIVFPEWSPVNGTLIKRRDFAYHNLLGHAEMASTPLFNDLGRSVFLPKPVADYPVCHYLKVGESHAEVRP